MNYSIGENAIFQGDCLDVLKSLPSNSIDSIVTDPPYGLSKEPNINEVLTKWMNGEPYDHGHGGFMGKEWDSFVPHPDIWKEAFRVLKHGGYALVFAGTRTQDLMTVSLRMAGFEVRDVIEWLYFSGFPKSMDIGKAFDKRAGVEREVIGVNSWTNNNVKGNAYKSDTSQREREPSVITAPATELAKQWDGWGTALKPAHEPIIVVRKPPIGTVIDNVEQFRTGAINIDASRIPTSENDDIHAKNPHTTGGFGHAGASIYGDSDGAPTYNPAKGRFPANIITVDDDVFYAKYCNVTPEELCKKASKKDRNADWRGQEIEIQEKEAATHNTKGRDMTNPKNALGEGERKRIERGEPAQMPQRNNHPTVKPTELMEWLVRLVTPPKGIVLDPFAGSGTTLVVAKKQGFSYIGVEKESGYIEIIEARTGDNASIFK